MITIDLTSKYPSKFWQDHLIQLQSDSGQLIASPKDQQLQENFITSNQDIQLFVLKKLKEIAKNFQLTPHQLLNLNKNARRICACNSSHIHTSVDVPKPSTKEKIERQMKRIVHAYGFQILKDSDKVDRLIPLKVLQANENVELTKQGLVKLICGGECFIVKLFTLKKCEVLHDRAVTALNKGNGRSIELKEVKDPHLFKLYLSYLETNKSENFTEEQLIQLLYVTHRLKDSSSKDSFEDSIVENFDLSMDPKKWNSWMNIAQDINSHCIIKALEKFWVWGLIKSIVDSSYKFEGFTIPDSFSNFGGGVISELRFFSNHMDRKFSNLYQKFQDHLTTIGVMPPIKANKDSTSTSTLSNYYTRSQIVSNYLIYQTMVRLSSKIASLDLYGFGVNSFIKDKGMPHLENLKSIVIQVSNSNEAYNILKDEQFFHILRESPKLNKIKLWTSTGCFPFGGVETLFTYSFKSTSEDNKDNKIADSLKEKIGDPKKILNKINLSKNLGVSK